MNESGRWKMMLKKHTRKTFYLGAIDELSIGTIRAKYGLSTDSDAVRLALRILAQNTIRIAKPKGK
jgi:Arc/MetJ family transcription regulator